MAELKVKVIVDKKQLTDLDAEIKKLKENAKTIKIDIQGVDTLSKLHDALQKYNKATTEATKVLNSAQNAEAKLTNARARLTKATNQLEVEQVKLQQGQERTAQSANRLATAEQRTQQELLKTERQAKKTGDAFKGMFSQFSMANIISSGVTRAISTMRSAFNEALQEMKALDLAATHYQQVMGSETTPEATKALTQQAYSVGSKYGTSASEYMESVATYARAGYKEAAEALAELSMQTVIVGQTTQEVADQFLLTMDAAYGYKGSISELSKVLDGASAIDSTYATTIEKIATGLGLVAPLANQVHTSEAELTAAIGTITAATQRSGSEAARALRSLFLNIIKDTTTEIEDGVTATEESVASVQYLLEKYAKSAVDAARATGEVVNPMEAIGALAQSMKEGLLTEQELMDLLSGIGGKLRISQLVALVQNWDMYTDMIGTYENAMGSADQKTSQYLDSWEAKTNILKNTWTEFVAKTISSDLIKGLLDAGTKLLQLVGDLGNGITILAGAIATIKLAKMAVDLNNLSKTLLNTAKFAASAGDAVSSAAAKGKAAMASAKSAALGWAAAIVGAITIAISAYKAYHNHRMQALEEDRDNAAKSADIQKEAYDKINEAYDAYVNAKKALDEGTISTEEYEVAVSSLASALGIENDALETNIGLIRDKISEQKNLTIAELTAARDKAVIAADEAIKYQSISHGSSLEPVGDWTANLLESGAEYGYGVYIAALYAQQSYETAKPYYDKLVELQDDYFKKYQKASRDGLKAEAAEAEEAYNAITNTLKDYAESIQAVTKYEERLAEVTEGTTSATKNADDATSKTSSSVDETAQSFHALADAIKEAENALADYEARTKTEKDTNYKKYAEAWEKAFEDIQAGRKNSNAVNAALDLFFTPEQILSMRKRGIEAADVIASDFYKSIFTYMDGEEMKFTGGEDAGSLLAYTLYDNVAQLQEDGKKVIKLGDYVAASFEEVNGELKLSVSDVGLLSEALMRLGIDADPDFLTVWLEGLGVFSDQFIYTASAVKEFASAVGALTEDGKIDLEGLITGQLNLGKSTEDVADLLDAVAKMAEAGEIELTVSGEDLDTTLQNCEAIITNRDDLDESTANVAVDVDTEDAQDNLDNVESTLVNISRPWFGEYRIQTSGLEALQLTAATLERISSLEHSIGDHAVFHTPSKAYASGTKSAGGGLALVNEEAPELIVENGAARIAGSGMPTLTNLASGAMVFNARETRAILGGSYPSELFDGINAYRDGAQSTGVGYNLNGITRWTPPSSSSSSSSSSSGGSSSSNSSSYSGASSGSSGSSGSSSSSSSSKDPQLEAIENRIKLLKSELSLMEERNVSLDSQIDKQREIQKAIQDQIIYMGTIGGDQAEINKLWEEYWKIDNDVRDLRIEKAKGELDVLEASNATVKEQIEKQREIATIYKEKLDILQQTGGSQIEINNLLKEELAIQESIAKLNKELMNDLADAINKEIDDLEEERDGYIDSIQAEIDALNKERDAQEEVNKEEELNLELMKAREALMNAQNQRTVRMYNAATGQWEWVADAQSIKSAQETYDSAEKALADYLDESAFNAKIDALTAEQERYTELYAEKTDKWQEILESMEDPIMTIAEALEAIENNATKDMSGQINDLNKLLAPLGYSISTERLYDSGGILSGLGGIKATLRDEAVLPPDVTARLLKPIQPAGFEQRMNELRYLYGGTGVNFGGMGGNIGSQHNGDLYTFGNVTLTTEQAQNTTIYDFVQAAKGLRSYSGRM